MLRHVVGVNLNYEKEDPRVREFFRAAKEMLGTIPQVKGYNHYVVDDPDYGYKYGFVLDFESKDAWLEYNEHPQSVKFTEEYWNSGVSNFMYFNFVPFE